MGGVVTKYDISMVYLWRCTIYLRQVEQELKLSSMQCLGRVSYYFQIHFHDRDDDHDLPTQHY